MVSRESATGGLFDSRPTSTIQIDENHSEMVKFAPGDHRIDILTNKLGEICGIENMASQQPRIVRRFSLLIRDSIPDSPVSPAAGPSAKKNEPPDTILWNNDRGFPRHSQLDYRPGFIRVIQACWCG